MGQIERQGISPNFDQCPCRAIESWTIKPRDRVYIVLNNKNIKYTNEFHSFMNKAAVRFSNHFFSFLMLNFQADDDEESSSEFTVPEGEEDDEFEGQF